MREPFGFIGARKMHNQRVEARSSFCGEDRSDTFVASRVAANPVDSLGREGDQLAAAQQRRSLIQLRCRKTNRHGWLAFLLHDIATI